MTSLTSLRLARAVRSIGLLIAFYAVIIYPACDDATLMEVFRIDPDQAELVEGDTLQLVIVTNYELEREEIIFWESSAPGIASVDFEGFVTAISPGTTTIKVTQSEVRNGDDVVEIATAEAVITVVAGSGEGEALEDGLVALPDGIEEPEAMSRLGQCSLASGTPDTFGPLSGGCLVTVGGADGFAVIDLATATPVRVLTGLSSTIGVLFGAIGLKANGTDAFFVFGATGYGFASTSNQTSLAFGPTTYDAYPSCGDPASGWATATGPAEGACTVGPDTDSNFGINIVGACDQDSQFDGELVSSFQCGSGPDEPRLILDRAVESGLYFDDGSGSGPTRVAEMGLDARRVRCDDDGSGNYVCGVTVFGDDRVNLCTWDGNSAPSCGGFAAVGGGGGFAAVGDGPVDLDVQRLPSGNYAVLTTGFNDSSITEIEVRPDGTVASTNTRPAPTGCESPGHAIYVRDASGMKVVGTCYNSDNYFVEDSRF